MDDDEILTVTVCCETDETHVAEICSDTDETLNAENDEDDHDGIELVVIDNKKHINTDQSCDLNGTDCLCTILKDMSIYETNQSKK